MAFWGIEVKPGKPYTHSFDRVRGRLHISQATLSIATSAKKSLVQCNVGDKSPILLCVLLPDKTESLQLDLEFEETDDVIFSVIGPRGVHLTGYHVGGCRNSSFQDDTESFGEDINSDSEESNRCADDEDEYDDSFINDGEPETLTPSPASSDGVDEVVYKKKKKDRKGGRKRLRKRYQMVESDDETCPHQNIVNGTIIVVESDDDEDKLPISSICKSRTPSLNMMPESTEEKSNEVTILSLVETSNKMKGDDGSNPKTKADSCVDSKEKVDAHFTNDETKMKEVPNCTFLMPAAVEDFPESQMNAKNKNKETEKIDDTFKEGNPQLEEEISLKSGGQNLLVGDMRDLEVATDNTFLPPPVEAGPEIGKKPKKKKKKYSKKEGQVHETDSGDPLKEDKGQQADAEPVTTDQDASLRNNDYDDRKITKKEGQVHETDSGDPLKEDKGQQADAEPVTTDQDASLRNNDYDDRKMEVDQLCEYILPSMEVCPEKSSKGKKKRKERTEVKTDFSGSYLPVRTEQDGKLISDNCDIVSDQLGDKYQPIDKKLKKKRRKKNRTEENVNIEVNEGKNTSVMETENKMDARSSEVRTLSNGLINEDPGTGNTKGKKNCSWRKGDKDVIAGLNVGLEECELVIRED